MYSKNERILSVAETGGFSAAARQLNVAPSVITKRIGQFEAEIGRQLFAPTTRRVELTATGQNLLHNARDFVLAYERMLNDVPDDAFALVKYDDPEKPAPITASQVLMPRRLDDRRADLWSVFNRTQESLIKGGLSAHAANGRRQRSRPVQGIDSDIRLNRALWLLADGMRKLKA